jgi:hypothetical protein
MRSCLFQLLFLVALVVGLLWFGLPMGAGWLATNAIRAAGFSGTNTSVEVSSSPPLLLLTGHADSIHLTSAQVTVGDLHAATVDMTLGKVDLIGRTAGSVDGALTGVSVAAPDGEPITVESVALSGSAASTQAQMKVSTAQAEGLAVSQLQARGVTGTVTLEAPDRVTIVAAGKPQSGQLETSDGDLLLVPDGPALPVITLIAPGSGNPFRVTAVSIAADGVTLIGTINLASLLGL